MPKKRLQGRSALNELDQRGSSPSGRERKPNRSPGVACLCERRSVIMPFMSQYQKKNKKMDKTMFFLTDA